MCDFPSSNLPRILNQVTSYKLSMQCLPKESWASLNNNTGSFECCNLRIGSSLTTADNGTYKDQYESDNIWRTSLTSMTHSSSRWCRDTSDEADNWFIRGIVLFQKFGSILLGRASNFTNHDYAIGFLIF